MEGSRALGVRARWGLDPGLREEEEVRFRFMGEEEVRKGRN